MRNFIAGIFEPIFDVLQKIGLWLYRFEIVKIFIELNLIGLAFTFYALIIILTFVVPVSLIIALARS